MANSLSSPCFVTNFEYSLDPIPSHRLSSSNTGSFSPSSSCALVEGESAAVGLSSAPRKSEHALSVFCFFAERCGDKRRVVRRLLPWRHVVRGGGVPLSPSKRLVLFLWSAAPARYVRAMRARSNDKTVRVPTYSSHQSVTPRITSFRLFRNYSSHEYSNSYTIQVMNTRVCILFKS